LNKKQKRKNFHTQIATAKREVLKTGEVRGKMESDGKKGTKPGGGWVTLESQRWHTKKDWSRRIAGVQRIGEPGGKKTAVEKNLVE